MVVRYVGIDQELPRPDRRRRPGRSVAPFQHGGRFGDLFR